LQDGRRSAASVRGLVCSPLENRYCKTVGAPSDRRCPFESIVQLLMDF